MKKARRHLPRPSEEPTARRLTFLSGSWHLTVQAMEKTIGLVLQHAPICCCCWSPQLHFFAATVPRGNEQPEETSTICISVLHDRPIWCAVKAGPFKGVTSDMAHGQAYNIDVKESASGLTQIPLNAKARTK